jgi:hypothetical protein
MNESMKRRDFIRLSAYSTALLGVPFISGCHYKPDNASILQPPFLVHIMDKKSLLDTGQQYLKLVPDENSSAKLEKILIDPASINMAADAETTHAYFSKKTVNDFATKQTVVVDGWLLSATEARQCALFALSES